MKYVVLDSFKADYKRLSQSEQATFKKTLPDFVAACDRYALDPSVAWPATLRVKDVESAPGIWEMTWSFSGPDGRATFEWIQVAGELAVRWRRIGGHARPTRAPGRLTVAPRRSFARDNRRGP